MASNKGKKPKIAASKANVESYKHKDKRKNIPTQELSHLKKKEKSEKKKYSYDPALDPQIIWSGKAIDSDLLDSLRERSVEERKELLVNNVPLYIQEKISSEAIINRLKGDRDQRGTMDTLFGESADQTFSEMVDFYKHDDNWANRMILGDSLEAMNSLLEKEQMRGSIQTVYIDPPYGIKFGSNWQVSTRKREVKDGKDQDYTRQPEQVKAFRDTWELGIHSYLSYLRDRLIITRELLTESGSCFVQINEENTHLIRAICDEVFGSENFISQIIFQKTGGLAQEFLPRTYDCLIWYAKDKKKAKFRHLFHKRSGNPSEYTHVELSNGSRRKLTREEKYSAQKLPNGCRLFTTTSLESANPAYSFEYNGKNYTQRWKTNIEGLKKLAQKKRISDEGKTLRYVRFYDDFPVREIQNVWLDSMGDRDMVYVVQTNEKIVQRCLLMTTDPGDIVLDPTCGSGTTAYVAEKWGRRWITMDTSRVALALARTRLMTAVYPWYELKNRNDIKEGFNYKTVPHITLRSLANDEEPQKEILYDQPKESKEIVRVAGPFTVESLAPHRVEEGNHVSTTEDYVYTVIENMRVAGIQTGEKGKRIYFESLDVKTSASGNIHAIGDYKEGDEFRKAAIFIGPEYGSVNDDMIRGAIKEAAKYYDLLVVAAPSFEASAFLEKENPFEFQIVKVKVSPDLSMGELLKKPKNRESANLFVAFGEPDIEIHQEEDGKISVEVKGVDIYDPTTGDLRSQSTDDIACWFIDTNYNEEAFFVTHAYFTGAQKPYEKLKKALKAEIDEELWGQLYTTVSRPLPKPSTNKVAIKVINHYGDEVMKVIKISEENNY